MICHRCLCAGHLSAACPIVAALTPEPKRSFDIRTTAIGALCCTPWVALVAMWAGVPA